MKKPKIVRYSSKGLEQLRQLGKSRTHWSKVLDMEDKDIDFSDSPEIPPDIFMRSLVQKGFKTTKSRKSQLTIRIDGDVLKWFKSQGHGYQTRINALLKAYKEAHRPV